MLTEEEAKTKWCPFARMINGDNRDWRGINSTNCIASQCMAWRWGKFDHLGERGYCGLAAGGRE